jgi:hypothetical protein
VRRVLRILGPTELLAGCDARTSSPGSRKPMATSILRSRHGHMRRLGMLGAVVAALVLGASPALGGDRPIRTLIDQSGLSFTLPAPDFCAFDVQLTVIVNREYVTVFPVAPDGSQKVLINGALVVQLTNLVTNKTLLVNASGPEYLTFYADGSATFIGEGLSLVFFPGQSIRLVAGRADFATGAVVAGHSTDLCAALSG